MMMPSGNTRVALGGFLLLFVASHLLYLVLIDPRDLVIQAEDKLYRDTIAKEILSGLHMPFIEYRADNYSGGSVVVGLIASVFFRLLGPTVFALKLSPLLFFTLALVFCSLTVRRRQQSLERAIPVHPIGIRRCRISEWSQPVRFQQP